MVSDWGVVHEWGCQSMLLKSSQTLTRLLRSLQTLTRYCSIYQASKWHGVVTSLSLFLLHSACLFVFASLVLQGIYCALLAPWTPLTQASVFRFTLSSSLPSALRFVAAGMHWLHSAEPGMKQWDHSQYETMRTLAPLQQWEWIAFLSVTDICEMK